jgi:heat shock protein HslJ
MKKVLYLCISLGILFAGCKSSHSAMAFSSLEGAWRVSELAGVAVLPAEGGPSLVFSKDGEQVSGFAGCNRISGKVVKGNAGTGEIAFPGLVATRMACLDMRTEDAFLKALSQTARVVAKGASLSFYGQGSQGSKEPLFVLVPAIPIPPGER